MRTGDVWVTAIFRWALVVIAAGASSACFFYNSQWGEREAEQRRAAERHAPANLRRADDATGTGTAPKGAVRTLTVRVYAAPEYVSETLDWQRRFADTVQQANEVLAADVNARLVVRESVVSRASAAGADLATLLGELRDVDRGDDVDLVIGLVGSLPRLETSFHQLGMAGILAKHAVVRAMNDAAEYQAIEAHLDELDEEERRQLYESRKRHKQAAVLLHEVGHLLGAIHVKDRKDVMHSSYSNEVNGFSRETRGILKITLRYPGFAVPGEDRQKLAEELAAYLRSSSSSPKWIQTELDENIAWLESHTRQSPQQTASGSGEPKQAQVGATRAPMAALRSESDSAAYEKAVTATAAGRHAEAWQAAERLFTEYPTDYAVQELRCKIAMAKGGSMDDIKAQCEPAMRLVRPTRPAR